MTTARSIIIFSLLFTFHSSLYAQPQFGAKIGRTYMFNESDYYATAGNNISVYIFPLRFSHISLGAEAEFNTKGFLEETRSPQEVKPIEYLSITLPVKFNPFSEVETEFYAFAAGRYDIILTSSRNFQYIAGYRQFNSTLGYSAGFGAQYTKVVPNFIIELSINKDLTEFETDVKNTFLQMKLGVLFDGL